MKIAVWANNDQWEELTSGVGNADYFRMKSIENIPSEATACFFLSEDRQPDFKITSKPVLINAVSYTLKEIVAPENVVRFNGWNTFLSGNTWEISGRVNDEAQNVFAALGKKIIAVPDEPGFVSARIIAMIINEAYYALQDKISTKEEIDTAMRLGTNYPRGPFEWASLIGVNNIFTLLQKLSRQDKRYFPSTLLKEEATR